MKSVRKASESHSEQIELWRAGRVVSTITGAFGQSIRETRLTAILGYLIALSPDSFLPLFGFKGKSQRIYLETRHDQGRSDILIETTLGIGVIEAKTNAADPLAQSNRYPAKWIALLTQRAPVSTISGRAKYVNWQQLGDVLEKHSRHANARVRILSSDLLAYLREHRMVKGRQATEIYAREINEPITLKLFLKAQLYACKYEASSTLPEALYFAPHFGKSIAKDHPGIGVGISYIARINSVVSAVTWKDFQNLLKAKRGNSWIKQHKEILVSLKKKWFERKKSQQRSFVFLDEPQLVFNPPVKKERLQKGRGWLSKRSFTFDELFIARNK